MIKSVLTIGSVLLLTAGVTTANAASTPGMDAGPVEQNSQAMAAADQMPAVNIRQQLRDQLTKAGFTDVTVMPSAFYVHAKNKQGDPVAMVIGPEGFTEVTEVPTHAATATSGTMAVKPPAASTAAPKQ